MIIVVRIMAIVTVILIGYRIKISSCSTLRDSAVHEDTRPADVHECKTVALPQAFVVPISMEYKRMSN